VTYTNFPGGLSSFGVPVIGGINGIPLTGSWFFVDYANGSDGNGVASGRTATGGNVGGATPEAPMKTLSAAHNLCLAGNNDVVVIMGDGSTTGTQRLTETLTWSKNATHLIGITAPVWEAQRARISTLTTATTNINPLMTVSASGCYFSNFSFFQGVGQSATAEQLIQITGSRNYFGNIQFGGMGAAAGAAVATSYIIYLNGGGENTFEHCSIGLETIQRDAANASVIVRNGAQRNTFVDCQFPMAASDTDPLWVDVNATNALNGSTMTFRRCLFRNLLNISSAATPAVVTVVAADANGTVYFDQCGAQATAWAANSTRVQVTNGAAGVAAGGLAVAIS
jgi:hypothetical protein